jgi:RNA polymerase sigma-70 factor, ECF subfamily
MTPTLVRAADRAANGQSPSTPAVATVKTVATVVAAAECDELSTALPALLPRLWRFALRLAGDRHDAEDLVQRACIRALERRHQLQPGTATLSWMFSIVHSVWLNEVRARQIRNNASLQWTEDLAATLVDSSAVDPETNALHQQVIAAVARLPDAQRAVMLLVAVEGLSYREAAEALDVPVGTVMSRLARARLTIGQAFGTGGSKDCGSPPLVAGLSKPA